MFAAFDVAVFNLNNREESRVSCRTAIFSVASSTTSAIALLPDP